MRNYPIEQWSTMVEEMGVEDALVLFYPGHLRGNPTLQTALSQLQMAEQYIDQFMRNLQENAECKT